MNAVIVHTLKQEFPEPWPLAERVQHLLDLLSVIREAGAYETGIDALTVQILEIIESIASGGVPDLDEATQDKVWKNLHAWTEGRLPRKRKRAHTRETDGDEK